MEGSRTVGTVGVPLSEHSWCPRSREMWLVSLPSLIKPSRSPVLAAAWIFIMPHPCGTGGIKLSVLISPMAPLGSWLVKRQSLGTTTLPASSGESWQVLMAWIFSSWRSIAVPCKWRGFVLSRNCQRWLHSVSPPSDQMEVKVPGCWVGYLIKRSSYPCPSASCHVLQCLGDALRLSLSPVLL